MIFANGSWQQLLKPNTLPAKPKDISVEDSKPDVSSTKKINGDYFENILTNPLDDYLQLKYNMRLSIVEYNSANSWDFINLKSAKIFPLMSSDLSSMKVETDRHYQITGFDMTNILSPKSPNEELSQVTEAVLKVTEPYGLSLYPEINRVASELAGYKGMSSAHIVWRLDIWFSGYDDSGNYVSNIPFLDRYSESNPTNVEDISYFFIVANITAEMEGGNTSYEITLIPFSQRGLSAEFSLLPNEGEIPLNSTDGKSVSFDGASEISFELYASKLEEYLRENSERVRQTMEKVISQSSGNSISLGKLRDFKIVIPESLKGSDKKLELNENFFGEGSNSLKISNNNIVAELQTKIGLVKEAHKGMNNIYPRRVYSIKTALDYSTGETSPVLKDLTNITVYFIIYEHWDFRITDMTQDQRLANSETRFNAIVDSGALRRKYEYMFSKANSEIINFKASLKNVWYNTIQDPTYGIDIANTADAATYEQQKEAADTYRLDRGGASQREDIKKQIPSMAATNEMSQTRAVYLGQKSAAQKRSALFMAEDAVASHNEYWNNFYTIADVDWLQEPLQNLEVRGDPRWLFTIHNSSFIESFGSTPVFADLILLEVRQPSQTEFMAYENLKSIPKFDAEFTGFYQIFTVKHNFSDGKYTQTFDGVRIPLNFNNSTQEATEGKPETPIK